MSRTYLPRGFDYRSLDTATTKTALSPDQLTNHAATRLRCSLFAGIDLQLMTANGIVRPGSVVSPKGAAVQDDRGKDGWQAAHALPSGLLASGVAVHLHAPGLAARQHVAEPYRVTNVVPRSVNLADRRAEVFRRGNGLGLIKAFASFGQKQVEVGTRVGGKIDIVRLRASYTQLVADYSRSLELLLANLPALELKGKTMVDGHVMIDPEIFRPSDQEYRAEEIRSILRYQLRGTTEMGYSLLRPDLVDQAEHDFYVSLKQDSVELKKRAGVSTESAG